MRFRTAILILTLSAAPAPALAQGGIETVMPGTRVRVVSPFASMVGHFAGVRGDSLLLTPYPGAPAIPIPLSSVSALRIVVPRSAGRGALLGTAWGFGIGGAVSGLACVSDMDACRAAWSSSPDVTDSEVIEGNIIVGGLGGALIGAVIGALRPGSRETDVPLSQNLSLQVAPRGVGVRFRP